MTDEELEKEFVGRVSMTLKFENWPTVWCMVAGGVQIPPGVTPRNFLLDSNAVTRLRSIGSMLAPEQGWWTTILDSKDTLLNPFHYAAEGEFGNRMPTREEFEDRYEEAVKNLRDKFSEIEIVKFDRNSYDAVYELVLSTGKVAEKENKFLVAIASLIKNPTSSVKVVEVENAIFNEARLRDLPNDSLAFYAALSCVYSPDTTQFRPAYYVLKPGSIEKVGNAYNATADFSILRLFIASVGLCSTHDLPRFSLVSSDKKLLMFWMGMRVRDFRLSDQGANAIVEYSKEMFPSLDENGRVDLAERVANLYS